MQTLSGWVVPLGLEPQTLPVLSLWWQLHFPSGLLGCTYLHHMTLFAFFWTPPHPPLLFSFWPGLFRVSDSDLGQECQWCAHSQQLALMAEPHASNWGKNCTESDRAKCHCVRHYREHGQCLSAQRENNYKTTRQDSTDTGRAIWTNVSCSVTGGLKPSEYVKALYV